MKKEKGFLRFIILLILALAFASYYFDFSLRDVFESKRTKENFSYIQEKAEKIYNGKFQGDTKKVWNFMKEYILYPFIQGMSDLKNHKETIFEKAAPKVILDKKEKDEKKETENEKTKE